MIQQKAQARAYMLFAFDLVIITLSFELAYFFRHDTLFSPELAFQQFQHYSWVLNFSLPVWSILLLYFGLYQSFRKGSLLGTSLKVVKACVLGTLLLGAFIFLFKLDLVSRIFIGIFVPLTFLNVLAVRLFLLLFARRTNKHSGDTRKVLVVGTGKPASTLAAHVQKHAAWGLELVGVVTDQPVTPDRRHGYPHLGRLKDISIILQRHVVDEVIFDVSSDKLEELEQAFLVCEELGVRARIAVNFFPHMIAKVVFDDFEGVPLLTFTTTPHDEFLLVCKRLFDIVVSFVGLLLLLPLLLIISVLIKSLSPGSILFTQTRVGLNGRSFIFYKFRTMEEQAEQRLAELAHLNEMEGPVFKMKHDPRVTWIGKFLRKFSWDELPQFWNVLRGDMSVVGPRPPLPNEVQDYKAWQRRRLSMKPGLTCIWQISGRNTIVDFDRWMQLDLQYIDTWSLKLDLKIFLRTIPVMLFGKGAS